MDLIALSFQFASFFASLLFIIVIIIFCKPLFIFIFCLMDFSMVFYMENNIEENPFGARAHNSCRNIRFTRQDCS